MNINSYRVSIVLSEYKFNFNFCSGVFEKLVFKVWLGYGTETSSGKHMYIWNTCIKKYAQIVKASVYGNFLLIRKKVQN